MTTASTTEVLAKELVHTAIFVLGGRVIDRLPTFPASGDAYWFAWVFLLQYFDIGTVWNPAGAVASYCKAPRPLSDPFVQSSGGAVAHVLGRALADCAGGVLGCLAFKRLARGGPVPCSIGALGRGRGAESVARAAAMECALTALLFLTIFRSASLGQARHAALVALYAGPGVGKLAGLAGHAACINPAQAVGLLLLGRGRGPRALLEPANALAYIAAPMAGGALAGRIQRWSTGGGGVKRL